MSYHHSVRRSCGPSSRGRTTGIGSATAWGVGAVDGATGPGAVGLARIGAPAAQPVTSDAAIARMTTGCARAPRGRRCPDPLIGAPPRCPPRERAVGWPRSAPGSAGIHQFHWPRSRMVAGTRSARTTVASSATAIAIPTPSALISTMSAKANDPATRTTIRAAEVTMRPLRSRPRATASVLSPRPVPDLLHP